MTAPKSIAPSAYWAALPTLTIVKASEYARPLQKGSRRKRSRLCWPSFEERLSRLLQCEFRPIPLLGNMTSIKVDHRFSALKMDGKPLYEYARAGIPLPRPIAPRKVSVLALELLSFTEGTAHVYNFPKDVLPDEERIELDRLQKMVKEGATVVPDVASKETSAPPAADLSDDGESPQFSKLCVASLKSRMAERPPIFEIRMTVTGGTYVRSIVHDIGLALGSSAHVVKLTRTRQGEFVLKPDESPASLPIAGSAVSAPLVPTAATSDATRVQASSDTAAPPPADPPQPVEEVQTFAGGCVEWAVLEQGLKDLAARKIDETPTENDDKMRPWEEAILHSCKRIQ